MTLSELQNKVKINFKDQKLLAQVFIHRSFLNEARDETLEHNERLEFLGDAVLELAVTDYLYNNYTEPEGVLTNWRAALVRGQMIGKIGEGLGFADLLQLSKGEQQSSGKALSLMMANALEAFIGAIYLDQGYETAASFINEYVITHLPEILENNLHRDPKSHLQEVLQSKRGLTPSYKIVDQSGPDHDKIFTAAVYAGNEQLGTGDGRSKQQAESAAATNALSKLVD